MSEHILRGGDGEPAVLHDLGGNGPPLLLTHGNGLNAGMWATVVPHLADRFHCWGLDFRGHGASRPSSKSFSVARHWLVAEVLAAVEEMGGPPVFAAGHSLGGAMLLLAARDHPATFRALWVFEPVLVPDDFPEQRTPSALVEASRRRRGHFTSVEEAYERFSSKPPFSACEPAAVRAYTELGTYPVPEGGVRLSCSGETEARIYESNERQDFATLAAVTVPTVVAAGEAVAAGNDLPPLLAPPLAQALPFGQLERFEGLTHFAPMEDGARIAEAIAEHLLRHAAG